MSAFDENDGGWASRKLHLTVLTQCLIFGGALLAAKYQALAPNYATLVGGLVGALGLYLGANATSKRLIGKNMNEAANTEDPDKGNNS